MIEQSFRNIVASKTTYPVYLNEVVEGQSVPYAVVYKTNAPRDYTHDGRSGMVTSRFQVSVFDRSYKSAKEFAGSLYSIGDYSDSEIAFIKFENEIDIFEDVSKLHHIAMDFIVRHYEQIGD